MSGDKDTRDPALGHIEDFPDDDHTADAQPPQTRSGPNDETDVVGVPLMKGEERVYECHPSWWSYLPDLILSGILYGVVGTLLVWIYTPLISYDIQPEIVQTFNEMYAALAATMTMLGYQMNPEFSIPWWVWATLLLGAAYPVGKAYLKARFTHYVITTDRVMSIRTFPGKSKDWAEIKNIRSFTSSADFLEQRLGVGSIKFQPANEDPIVFHHMDDYEYWESNAKQIHRDKTSDEDVEIDFESRVE